MSEWRECTLGDVSTGRGEYGIAASAVEYSPDKYTYLRITDINDDGTIDFSGLKSVEGSKAEHYLLKPNDIVFARTGASTGRNYFYDGHDGRFVYAGFLIKFALDSSKVYPKFIKYHCLSERYRAWISQTITGSTRGNINAVSLAQMPLRLPSLPTQRRIAAVLGALDDKIELNRKMNANLEAMAQTLFKSWFVDFEPFGGQMPEGWRRGTLGEIAEVVGGGTPSKANDVFYADHGIAWLTPKDLSITHAKFTSHGSIDISQAGYDNSSARLMPKGSVLFSSRAPIGYLTIAENEICTNQGFKSLVPIAHVGTAFLYYYMLLNTDRIQRMASGSTFKEASGSLIKGLELNLPPDETCDNFEEMMRPIFGKQRVLEHESRTLAQLRDTLLPKLMSGELNVEGVRS